MRPHFFAFCRAGDRRRAVARKTSGWHTGRRRPCPGDARAFSLIEVIAAVVVFAIGMVAVLGLFAPVSKSVSTVSDSEAAARVADAVRARLQALPFNTALTLVQEVAEVRKKDGDGNYNPNDGTKYPAVLFAKLAGELGIYDAGVNRKQWYDSSVPTPLPVANADKFFEIDLIRNDQLSPKGADATAALVAYTMRVRWPMFLPGSNGNAVQVGANPAGGGAVPYDHSKKQVMFFTGAITR
ncbi:MAG: prepilin-type N-terminal cleavage/methylation domain-containing protein [Opitutus sp.]|nr:prepilin-type N-terminal cleavage/methylation domain-containing protein [Opitutus sp.]